VWMYQRALQVLKSLWTINSEPLKETHVSEKAGQGEVRDWERVGSRMVEREKS
jgi:hypothetical protein